MIVLIVILALSDILLVIDQYVVPIPSHKIEEWKAEERRLGRELYFHEVVERGYCSMFRFKWIIWRHMIFHWI